MACLGTYQLSFAIRVQQRSNAVGLHASSGRVAVFLPRQRALSLPGAASLPTAERNHASIQTRCEAKAPKRDYKQIKNKRFLKKLLDLAEESVAGAGDGRISVDDAKKLFAELNQHDLYSKVDKRTVGYIRETYKWTEAANKWFSAELARLEESKSRPVDEELLKMAHDATAGAGDGRISLADAKTILNRIWEKGYNAPQKAAVAYMRGKLNWTDAADEWFRKEIRKNAAASSRKPTTPGSSAPAAAKTKATASAKSAA
eukprot:jgi/Mesvir1/26425/Mv16115-RA.1